MSSDHPGTTVLDVRTCVELLHCRDLGRVALIVNDHPEIFPVNFVVDRGTVVFRTAEGTKLSAVIFGSKVAFEVDGYDTPAGDAWSVVVKGLAAEIKRGRERLLAAELPLFPWHASPKPRFIRIEPVEITGRRFRVVDPTAWMGKQTPLNSADGG